MRRLPRARSRQLMVPALILAGACVSVNSTVLMDRSAFPVAPAEVYVYLAGDTVPSSCERVALLYGEGDQESTNPSQMIGKFREEAGKLGANAVHLRTMKEADTPERIAAWILDDVDAQRRGEAVALWCPVADRRAGSPVA